MSGDSSVAAEPRVGATSDSDAVPSCRDIHHNVTPSVTLAVADATQCWRIS